MKITAKDLKEFGIIDEIIKEPRGGAHKNPMKTCETIKNSIVSFLEEVKDADINKLVNDRYNKFRKMGDFY